MDVSIGSSNTNHSAGAKNVSSPNSSTLSHNKPSPDFYIIRVTVESDSGATDGIVMYKSIMLSNNERTPQVIRNAILKLGLEGNPDNYTLAQVLPDKGTSFLLSPSPTYLIIFFFFFPEMVLPTNANVYYAVNTAYNLNFILRPKKNNPEPEKTSPYKSRTNKK